MDACSSFQDNKECGSMNVTVTDIISEEPEQTGALHNKYHVGDNLEFLKGLEKNSIDFIYFDPPYNTGRNFYNFDDRFTSVQEYLEFIRSRIRECETVLDTRQ